MNPCSSASTIENNTVPETSFRRRKKGVVGEDEEERKEEWNYERGVAL